MDLQQFQFIDIIAYYKNRPIRPLKTNKAIAKTLNISQSTFYRYHSGNIPDENRMTSSKRKIIIRQRGLIKRKQLKSVKVIPPKFKIVSVKKSVKLTKKQITKRSKRLIKKVEFLLTAFCSCKNTYNETVKHHFRAYIPTIRSDNVMIDFMIKRHNVIWSFVHDLQELSIISVIEVPSILIGNAPFKSKKTIILRRDKFDKKVDQ